MNIQKLKLSAVFIGLFLASSLSFGQNNFNFEKLDSLMKELSIKNKFMGSLTIRKNDQILYNKAFGFSLINGKASKKATTDTKYRVGSITKMFTAVMIFQLVEEHQISLKTKLAAFFPEIPNADKISISNLMNHRSGIHSVTDDSNYLKWNTKPQTESEMIARIIAHKPDFTPNEKTAYSNSNFIILGYIIEKITRKDYASNLQERIANKIGLKNTYYGGRTNLGLNESISYDYANNEWIPEPETDLSVPHGAGAIVSTTNDLSSFVTSLFFEKLISRKSLDSMTSMEQDFGRGIFAIPFYDRKSFGHTGIIDKFASLLSFFPDDSVAIAFCTNELDYNMNDITIGILSIFYDKPYEIPSLKDIHVDPELLKKYEGVYSSKDIPIKLTIKIMGGKLTGQGTGQQPFPLEAINDDEFTFAQANITIRFMKGKDELTLKQNGADFILSKEK